MFLLLPMWQKSSYQSGRGSCVRLWGPDPMVSAAQGGHSKLHRIPNPHRQISSWPWWEVWHLYPSTLGGCGHSEGPEVWAPSLCTKQKMSQAARGFSVISPEKQKLEPMQLASLSRVDPKCLRTKVTLNQVLSWTPRKTWCWHNVKWFGKTQTNKQLKEKI